MPHVLTASEDLAGSGVWTWPGGGDVADLLYVEVTTRGALVAEMDSGSPPRLFQAGWLAIGATMPSNGGAQFFSEPIWIVFDKMIINAFSRDVGHAGDLGVTSIRYELVAGTEVNIQAYTFT